MYLIYIYIYGTPPKKNLHFLILYRYLQWFLHFWRPFFLGIFLLVLEVVFINVYKHRGCWIQDPRSKILGKTSWIQGLDPRSKILGKTSWIQTLDPISFFCRSIVFINVYKHLETCQNPRCPEKGFREGPKYWKIQISPDPSHVWTLHLLSKLPYTFSRVNFQDFCNISLNWISL